MKKHLLLFACTLIALNGFSQPTLYSSDLPAAGETYVMNTCNTAGVTEGPAGANQTWTFTAKVNTGTQSESFVSPSSTPGAASFPTATLAIDQGGNNYIYLEISSSQGIVLGFYNAGTVVTYTDAQKLFQFPFTYNTSFTDVFSSTFMLAGNTVYRNGTVTVTGDAHGTLILPNATYSNCLRIKTSTSQRDSAFIGLAYFVDTETEQYEWWHPSVNYTLKRIQYDTTVTTIGTTTTSSNSKDVSYFAYQVGVTEHTPITSPVTIFPNPASELAEVEFSLNRNSVMELEITDVAGRKVKNEIHHLAAGDHKLTLNVSDLHSGVYSVRIALDGFTGVTRIVVQ